ncbi:family 43 glycosylhydrolase [Sandaracinus amylolyticus]|uniref:family 43 glycosylhydrolase n=1 Tax=Sandaracinus amylolyticus TaxID=927083 RepID=UPI001F2E2593|nr:family 43 glycosylhydrolase [Sandaracinus amylolyticus]
MTGTARGWCAAVLALGSTACSGQLGDDDRRIDAAAPAVDAAIDAGTPDSGTPDAGPPRGLLLARFDDYHAPAHVGVVPAIDFVWGDAPLGEGAPSDFVSARFTALLTPPATGTYTIATENDDGVRVWIDDALVIDDWRGHLVERHEGTIELVAGTPVRLRVDYFEIDLAAQLRVLWTPPGGTESPIDETHALAVPLSAELPPPAPHYTNPVVPFDCPDPGVLADESAYYMVCTGGRFPIRRSRDLVRWSDTGAAVIPSGAPPWAANGHRNWAPELHRVGDRYVAYFTSVNGANVLSIGAAWADDPLGPYTVTDAPLVEHPDGVIDGNYFRDDDGRHYLFYKIDGNAHGRPTPIFVRELAADGLSFTPGSVAVEVLRNDPGTWEGGVVEASWTVRRGDFYYLFYSGNVYDGRYRTGVARSRSVTGPYEKHGAPILTNDARWVGPGHGTVLRVGDQDWFFYHAWNATAGGGHDGSRGRFGLLDPITWEGDWPRIGDGTPGQSPRAWPGRD